MVTKPHLSKLEERSLPMVFLGYEAGSKAYRFFDPCGGIGECNGGHVTFIVEHLVIHSGGGARQEEPGCRRDESRGG
jgi:hypothetical protein